MSESIFHLTWLLPLLPFTAFLLIILWANPHKRLSAGIALGGIGSAWLLGWAIAYASFGVEEFETHPFECSAIGSPPEARGKPSDLLSIR